MIVVQMVDDDQMPATIIIPRFREGVKEIVREIRNNDLDKQKARQYNMIMSSELNL